MNWPCAELVGVGREVYRNPQGPVQAGEARVTGFRGLWLPIDGTAHLGKRAAPSSFGLV